MSILKPPVPEGKVPKSIWDSTTAEHQPTEADLAPINALEILLRVLDPGGFKMSVANTVVDVVARQIRAGGRGRVRVTVRR